MNTSHMLLWSQRQNALRIEKTEAFLSANRLAYRDNSPVDAVPLMFGTAEQCQGTANNLHGTMAGRASFGPLPPAPPGTEWHRPADGWVDLRKVRL
jgi:hypothetical protein